MDPIEIQHYTGTWISPQYPGDIEVPFWCYLGEPLVLDLNTVCVDFNLG